MCAARWIFPLLLLPILHCNSLRKIPYRVKQGYRFELHMGGAGEIQVIGSWNNWQRGVHTMQHWGSYYWLDLDLPPGRHEYAFSSDVGRIMPENIAETIEDGFGGVNAVAVVE